MSLRDTYGSIRNLSMEAHPEIIEIKACEVWHSDVTCNPIPLDPLSARNPPRTAAETLCWPTCTEGMKPCRPPVRSVIDGLTAVHDGDKVFRLRQDADRLGSKAVRHEQCRGRNRVSVSQYDCRGALQWL